jgi:predicted RNA-binding protein YlxR (DUF448 family)
MSTTRRHPSTNTSVSWGRVALPPSLPSPICRLSQNPGDRSALRIHNVDHNSPGRRRWIMLHCWAFWKVKRKKRSSRHFSSHSTLHTPHSTIHTCIFTIAYCTIHAPHSTIHNTQPTLHTVSTSTRILTRQLLAIHGLQPTAPTANTPQTTLNTQAPQPTTSSLQFTVHSPHFTPLNTFHSHSTLDTTLHTPLSTLSGPQSTPRKCSTLHIFCIGAGMGPSSGGAPDTSSRGQCSLTRQGGEIQGGAGENTPTQDAKSPQTERVVPLRSHIVEIARLRWRGHVMLSYVTRTGLCLLSEKPDQTR